MINNQIDLRKLIIEIWLLFDYLMIGAWLLDIRFNIYHNSLNLTILEKDSAFRLAPPTNAPSIFT